MSGRYVDRQTSYNQNTAPATYNSNLAGLETSASQPESRESARYGGTNPRDPVPYGGTNTESQVYAATAGQDGRSGENGDATEGEYPYRARAIYSYEANPDDANELSFLKHEILDISDVSGRWWQARKDTGQTGIAPSNYLVLL
jgi:SHO1 osmosensor